ncbi:hypothetical protein Q3W71_24715 [Micromonospora sp. C28SCA-DRY-2]|uniref:hypothetical protein n=1 Tax=Micromonospora sp. C28SCA-DRY-2 TaxID=3059522 RepID=UPI002676D73D|nr:hypothetical protein [Micromonospora sp. C28SCA-DRY-2]MDO3704873.1 hypothetical protein [Micromonospora sp. C28SCA-DRY-2]
MHPDDHFDQKLTEERPDTPPADAASSERTIGRHRAPEPSRRGVRALLTSAPARVALATGVSCCLGVATIAVVRGDDAPREPLAEAVAERAAAADEAASRSLDRAVSPAPVSPSPTPKPTPSATKKKAPKKPAKPRRPRPVAGLTQAQMDNAKIIVDVGVDMKIPRRGLVVAIATAMQESNLYNYASGVLPESQNYPHQAIGWDHDSVGLFQQRPSSGWGTVKDLMRPAYAARAFYEALREIPGWQEMSVTAAAQAVQISAFPDAYAQHEGRATTVVAALV